MLVNSRASASSAGLFCAAHSRSSRRWLMFAVWLHGVNVCALEHARVRTGEQRRVRLRRQRQHRVDRRRVPQPSLLVPR